MLYAIGGSMIHAGIKRFGFVLVLLGACLHAATADPEVKAGGVSLTLPGPSSDFAEVGDKLRTTVFDLLAPATNRLLAAYLLPEAIAKLNVAPASSGVSPYAMIQVSRRAEYVDCTPEVFQAILTSLATEFGKSATTPGKDMQDELNSRLKALGEKPVEIGETQMLGGVFQKTDASGFAMLSAVKRDDRRVTMIVGVGALRVKQRLVLLYLYRTYESPATATLIRKELEGWADAILEKNTPAAPSAKH